MHDTVWNVGRRFSVRFVPRLTRSLELYKRGLPEVAFARLLGLQDAVTREVAVWSKHMGKARDYAPTEIRLGGRVNGGRTIGFN